MIHLDPPDQVRSVFGFHWHEQDRLWLREKIAIPSEWILFVYHTSLIVYHTYLHLAIQSAMRNGREMCKII